MSVKAVYVAAKAANKIHKFWNSYHPFVYHAFLEFLMRKSIFHFVNQWHLLRNVDVPIDLDNTSRFAYDAPKL